MITLAIIFICFAILLLVYLFNNQDKKINKLQKDIDDLRKALNL